jgi:hypothetical protein
MPYSRKESQMPKTSIQADQSGGEPGAVTLSERMVATHLHNEHYVAQLLCRTRSMSSTIHSAPATSGTSIGSKGEVQTAIQAAMGRLVSRRRFAI